MIKRVVFLSVSINLLLLFLLLTNQKSPKDNGEKSTLTPTEYSYLSRRIFVENPSDIIINFVPLRTQLRELLSEYPDQVSLYFEYLPSGISIGINEKNEVRLASLSKIPTVMSIYKKIEKGELSKEDQIEIKPEFIDPQFGTTWKKGIGATISVEEAVTKAITESDNTAHKLLKSLLTTEEINHVYEYLDIPFHKETHYPLISAKNYSSVLKSLFFSSYLTFTSSQEILEIMTKTIYLDKIPAGVPTDIPIAHKIGVYQQKNDSASHYSDCGIVYAPNRPYILCIMVKNDENFARSIMQQASKVIHQYISK